MGGRGARTEEGAGVLMGQEGPEHKTMGEAFAKRLRQLYPTALFSEGKKVKPVNLKPDIFIQHSDGRQWAFEMVYGNHHTQHLLDNHQRYAATNVNDVWILWDELRPRTGTMPSLDQGVMDAALDMPATYPLTAPQRAILEMQSGDVRYLYAFTADPLSAEVAALQMIAIGLYIYRFEGWNGEKKHEAQCAFVSLNELIFQEDGRPTVTVTDNEQAQFVEWTRLLGLDVQNGFIPNEMIEQVERAMLSPQKSLAPLLSPFLQAAFSRLSPEQMQEIATGLKSSDLQERLAHAPRADFSDDDLAQAFQNPEAMQRLGEETRRAKQTLRDIGLPEPLWVVLDSLLDDRQFLQIAELMKWQAESEALHQSRGSR